MTRPAPPRRADFAHFLEIPTRWRDNDVYGHINNVVYYEFFDTAVNRYLIDRCGLDIHGGTVIGLVVETTCRFHAALAFPDSIEAGIRIERIGRSSVVYAIGLFSKGKDVCAADGHFVHVYVDRESRRPVDLPENIKAGLAELVGPSEQG